MDQKKLERKAQLFDWLATRIAYADIRLSFGGRHKAYAECDPKKLEAEIEKAKGFEKESDEIRAKEAGDS